MSDKLKNFLKEFQDAYILDQPYLTSNLPVSVTKQDLILMDKYLTAVNQKIDYITNLNKEGAEGCKEHYTKLINILNNKLDYIEDIADTYTFINSFFDLHTVKDLASFKLDNHLDSNCTIENNTVLLSHKRSLSGATKSVDLNTVYFYNVNQSSHGSIELVSPVLEFLPIKSISIRKNDGTVLILDVPPIKSDRLIIDHPVLTSSVIIIELLDIVPDVYIKGLSLNLLRKDYLTEGYHVLGDISVDADRLFLLVNNVEVSSNTYANVNLTFRCFDLNGNLSSTENVVVPLGKNVICKRLQEFEIEEAVEIVSLRTKDDMILVDNITEELLKELKQKEGYYITYKKNPTSSINNHIRQLGDYSFKVNQKIIKKIDVSATLELFSFERNKTPRINNIAGVTKYETL